ncbi:bifunctional phosphoribosylaminoimidazolecarboxamide formyltransferase/IMP cyclohydrolase [Brachybacterium sp. EF45031]|uniref:bifunctional phosphoribosylaminoimidazolecarboxamide formyltransferase/IMP cyclohydrolase n=1 Tax=Brachybacterium sillae TaxID=2810536 RepID=UPI00217EB120|nr:bifunctional phosphoribosylaminoimidazolecarboxamide formyltransferase/IMP cyclohydrolase [Brachybacterium sillae]MCS6711273.1 bifunctional phosphoribosylaminoimidazolecarboxamide formyltransferase/IMP cyclohydrolase [Brachybacterium sillae]
MSRQPIRRALVSVYDKTGLEDLARALHGAGAEILSTGSTAATIRELGIPVTDVSAATGFPEMLDGRVKTLHPVIHGGILADRTKEAHVQQLEQHGIAPIDLVVVNLYPFEETVAAGGTDAEIIEKIDIGGPAMVRSAAKNFASCAVVVHAAHYALAGEAAARGGFTLAERRLLSAVAFDRIAGYDDAIAEWTLESSAASALEEGEEETQARLAILGALHGGADEDHLVDDADEVEDDELDDGALEELNPLDLPEDEAELMGFAATLRYGENPHQRARLAVVDDRAAGLAGAEQLGGKPMSYNNYVDADAALRAVFDHPQPCVAVVKHNNPCGLAIARDGEDVAVAHAKAHATDPVSAYGGVIAVNRPVSVAMAQQVAPVFTEVIAAPGYEDGALEVLQAKKNLRILQVTGRPDSPVLIREIWGGTLIQDVDHYQAEGDDPAQWTLAAGEPADAQTLADLEFAWRSVRAVKSNAILLASDGAAVGVGMGQVNRVDSCRLAVERANSLAEDGAERARGAVAASDAFFPFADGLQILLDAGVRAVVQPGGSIRDDEVIEACRAAGVTMYLTGARHFAH